MGKPNDFLFILLTFGGSLKVAADARNVELGRSGIICSNIPVRIEFDRTQGLLLRKSAFLGVGPNPWGVTKPGRGINDITPVGEGVKDFETKVHLNSKS